MSQKNRPPDRDVSFSLSGWWEELTNQFDRTRTGRRRLFFFAIGMANGFLSLVACLTVLRADPGFWWAALLLWLLGILFFNFAYRVATGSVSWLITWNQGL